MRVAAVQARPVWGDTALTTAKVIALMEDAAAQGAELIVFPETFLCGYPFWLCRTNGAAFNDPRQRKAYAFYLETAVEAGGPELTEISEAASELGVFVFLGLTERGTRSAHGSTFCTLAAIHPERGVVGMHRKLQPTHDERLVWARGDGNGLRAHEFNGWRLGGLNCWENWMPQARHALYADGIDLHVAAWPGWSGLTGDITRFIAMEGRVVSVAASGLLSLDDVPADFPMLDEIRAEFPVLPFDGGSGIAGPTGAWLAERVIGREEILFADVELAQVREERMMFDAAGHYARPDVFDVVVDRRRLDAATFDDGDRAARVARLPAT
jgi:nitrilase